MTQTHKKHCHANKHDKAETHCLQKSIIILIKIEDITESGEIIAHF